MLAGIHVDLDVYILAGMDSDQLGLFVVGVDMKTVVRDQREQWYTDADQRPCSERQVADLAVLRCNDMRMFQIEPGLVDGGLCLQYISPLAGLYRSGQGLGQFGVCLFQRRLQSLHAGPGIVQGLLGEEMLLNQLLVADVSVAGVGQIAFGLGDQRACCSDFGAILAGRLPGEGEIGPGSLKGNGERLWIDVEQRIAFVYVLVVLDVHGHDATADLCSNIHHIRVDVGILGTTRKTGEIGNGQADNQHNKPQYDDDLLFMRFQAFHESFSVVTAPLPVCRGRSAAQ